MPKVLEELAPARDRAARGRSARMKSHRGAPRPAKAEVVASAAGHPRASTVSGTRGAPTPPTTLPPVFIAPPAAQARLPATETVASQKAPSVSC